MSLLDDIKNAMDPGYVSPHAGANQTVAGNVAAAFGDFKQELAEKTQLVVDNAKASIMQPFQEVVSSTKEIARRAIPTALASAATMQYTGGKPSFAAFLQPVSLRSRFLWAGYDRHERIGYPLEDFRVLSTQSGFIQCENVRLELAATATTPGATLEEQQLIKQYLEAGCYIE